MQKLLIMILLVAILIFLGIYYYNYQPKYKLENVSVKSSNWAGYVVASNMTFPTERVEMVSGSWKIPAVNCTNQKDYFSSFWVGIDGYFSETIEQIGTDSDCINGNASYGAWYEILPAPPKLIDISISPDDQIYAEVKYIGDDKYELSIKNLNTSEEFYAVKVIKAQRLSAEWIAEAPSLNGRTAPLSNFSIINFSKATLKIGNISGTINDSNWEFTPIFMQDRTNFVKARPTELTENGTSFSVVWERA